MLLLLTVMLLTVRASAAAAVGRAKAAYLRGCADDFLKGAFFKMAFFTGAFLAWAFLAGALFTAAFLCATLREFFLFTCVRNGVD